MSSRKRDKPRRDAAPGRWRWRLTLVNVWLVLHFIAVGLAAGTAGPTSELAVALWGVFKPYLLPLYLNQGYGFYAPEPTPSNLLEFEAELADGRTIQGVVPDPSLKPRLLYQRNLLLTEHVTLAPPDRISAWYKSYARHLCHAHGARSVRLTRVTHYPPTREMVRQGVATDDPSTYERVSLGEYPCEP